MGNYRRVVYEEKGDLSPETRKGRKINYDLDILQADTRSREKLLVFKEDNEKLYTPKQALNYLKEFKNLKDDKDLHKASYTAAIQVILRFCRCYDGKINGKLLPTLSALKKFESKYPQYGKVKGLFSRETLLALEKYLAANEKHLNTKYAYEDENGGKKKAREVLNISVKELVQKNTSNASNSSHTSQSQQTSQNSSRTSTSSSSSNSSSSTQSERSSSSNSSSSSSNSSTQSPNKASTSSTPSTEGNNSKTTETQPTSPTQTAKNTAERSPSVNQPESKSGEQSASENPQPTKTPEELEKEEIEKGKKSLEKALNNIKDTLQTYTTKLTELQDKINGLQPTSTDSNEKLLVEEKKSNYLKQKQELETTIQDLTQQQTDLSNQLSTLLGKENITRNDLQNIQNQLTPLQKEVNTLVKNAKQLINDVNSYEKDLTPEKPSGTISPEIGQYFKNLRTYVQIQDKLDKKPNYCTAYALTASTEMLKQQGIILPMPTEKSARELSNTKSITQYFDIKKPQTPADIKKQILEAPAGSIITVRYAGVRREGILRNGTDQPESRGVSHAMVSLGGGKYTDLIGDDQRTIDLNKITIQSDPTWGFIFTDNQGRSFRFVTKTDQVTKGSGSSILIPRNNLEGGKPTTFDFNSLWDIFSHNYGVTLNQKVYSQDFPANEKLQRAEKLAKKTGLDVNAIYNNFIVSQGNGKCNIVLKPNVHLFAALIQKHTGQSLNYIRAKLYEKLDLDRTKGDTAVQGKSINLPCNKKLETKQTTPIQPREQNEDLSYKEMSRTLKSNPSNYKNGDCEIEFTNDLKQNLNIAYNALKNGKQTIMKQFPKLTNKEYDEIAKKCLGILYKETKIGLDMETSTLWHNTTGISELSWNSAVGNQTYQTSTNIVNKLKAVGVQSIEDFNDIATGTKGTMVVLIQRYYDLIKRRVKGGNRKNSQNELMTQDNCYEYLYYIWNNYQGRITGKVSQRIPPKELYACRVINRFIQLSVQE